MEYVHSELFESLSENNTNQTSHITMRALAWIENVRVITERILNGLISCFNSQYGTVRSRARNFKITFRGIITRVAKDFPKNTQKGLKFYENICQYLDENKIKKIYFELRSVQNHFFRS